VYSSDTGRGNSREGGGWAAAAPPRTTLRPLPRPPPAHARHPQQQRGGGAARGRRGAGADLADALDLLPRALDARARRRGRALDREPAAHRRARPLLGVAAGVEVAGEVAEGDGEEGALERRLARLVGVRVQRELEPVRPPRAREPVTTVRPLSTRGGTRLVRLVREGGGRGGGERERDAQLLLLRPAVAVHARARHRAPDPRLQEPPARHAAARPHHTHLPPPRRPHLPAPRRARAAVGPARRRRGRPP